jgi:hypothetical protein
LHQYHIHCLSFSPDGETLVSFGGDAKHASQLIVYQWKKAMDAPPGHRKAGTDPQKFEMQDPW